MRNLVLSSIILSLFLCSCSKNLFKSSSSNLVLIQQNELIKPIADDTSVIYKTAVNAYGRYLSGLLIIKAYTDDDYRMVFTTETGVKLFDFEFKGDEFHVHYCMEMLNKKPVINLLRADFSLMLARDFVEKPVKKSTQDGIEYHFLENENELWYISLVGKEITNIKSTSLKGKTKLLITYSYNNSTIPNQIILAHKNLNLDMKLDMLIR